MQFFFQKYTGLKQKTAKILNRLELWLLCHTVFLLWIMKVV